MKAISTLAASALVVLADLDRDGDQDVIHSATNAGATIFENTSDNAPSSWIGLIVDPRQWSAGTDALIIRIETPEKQLTSVRAIQRGGWYQANRPPEAHFGLTTEARRAIESGEAHFRIEELGSARAHCLPITETDQWITLDLASVDLCNQSN